MAGMPEWGKFFFSLFLHFSFFCPLFILWNWICVASKIQCLGQIWYGMKRLLSMWNEGAKTNLIVWFSHVFLSFWKSYYGNFQTYMKVKRIVIKCQILNNKIQMHSSVLIIWSSNLLEFDIIKYTNSYLKAPLLLKV